jgi:precorrin-4/cobalt-precorrin-4 C11-methyltransferase
MKVFFIGAGPGDRDLITVKGRDVLGEADIVVYAGSLVAPGLLDWARDDALRYNSAEMDLDEIQAVYREVKEQEGIIARLHTGDPSIYGAIQEQIDFCMQEAIPFEIVPGVSSFSAGAARLEQELTLPGVSQTVILSRISGRTKTPEAQDLEKLASHCATMVIFLSAGHISRVVEKLLRHYAPATPAAVLYRVTWEGEEIIRCRLDGLEEAVKQAGIERHALIYVGEVLDGSYDYSKLYDKQFTHGYRKGSGSSNG